MKTEVKTIPELRRLKWIKLSQIEKVISRQTYYNWIKGKSAPYNKQPIQDFCNLLEIDRKTFDRLLKNTINL